MDALVAVTDTIDTYMYTYFLVFLLIFTGLYFSIRTKFIQFRGFKDMIRHLTEHKHVPGKKSVSSFQALMVSTASRVGTGNIAGVATAIAVGGPGAVFWMWVMATISSASAFIESTLAQIWKIRGENGEFRGGPAYYIQQALHSRALGVVFAISLLLCFGLGFNGLQTYNMSSSLQAYIPNYTQTAAPMALGILLAVVFAFIIFGGTRLISYMTSVIVPTMAGGYILLTIILSIMNIGELPGIFATIVTEAFDFSSVVGGFAGSMVVQGIKRGLFSNESGLGSAPIVASAASTRNPARQALVSMTGTFWDTVVICALTGIVLVSTMLAHSEVVDQIASGSITAGAQLTSAAFASIPYVGTPILVVGMILFSYSTILGWSYYGNRCAAYLFGKHAVRPYQVLYVLAAFVGSLGVANVVWNASDVANALMAVPNIIVVLLLSGLIARETRHYVYSGNLDEASTDEIPQHADK